MSEISQLVQDRRGDIWIGYAAPFLNRLEKSVFRFDGEHFDFVGTEDGDIDNCFVIYEDHDGYLWFGGVNGLFRYDGTEAQKNANTRRFRQYLCNCPRIRKGNFFLVIGKTA